MKKLCVNSFILLMILAFLLSACTSAKSDFSSQIDIESIETAVEGTQVVLKGLDCDWLEYNSSNGQLYFANARFIKPLAAYLSEGTATFDRSLDKIEIRFTYAIQGKPLGLAEGQSISFTADIKKGKVTQEKTSEDFSDEDLKEIAYSLFSIFEYLEEQKVV